VRSLEEANRDNQRIIAALTSHIPAIVAPQERLGAPKTAAEEPEGAEPRFRYPGPQPWPLGDRAAALVAQSIRKVTT
jgi:hypothetical protein